MTTAIRPALTPEGWNAPFAFAPNTAGEVDDTMVVVTPREEVWTIKGRHAHAAIALNGQPFGFTWNDVDDLRATAHSSPAAFAERITNLADRIEALLPPRTA